MSGNEVSQILFSIVLNYYGGRGHRPRWLAFGMVCVVICSLIMASPHFFLGPGELVDRAGQHGHSIVSRSIPSSLGNDLPFDDEDINKTALIVSPKLGPGSFSPSKYIPYIISVKILILNYFQHMIVYDFKIFC
jgi:hypothetical protein